MKKIRKVVGAILAIGVLYALMVGALIFSGVQNHPQGDVDTVVILGAQVRGKKKSEAYPSTVLRERLDTALTYLKEHPTVTVIVCGGQGADEVDSEANVMATYLIEHGIEETRILREDQSTRTKENLRNAKEMHALGRTLIVTSDFHSYRANLLAHRLGIQTAGSLPAASQSNATVKSVLREFIALGYALIFDW